MNVKNEQLQQANQASLKNQEFEALGHILNRPIAEDYDHRNLGGQVRSGKYGFDTNPFDDLESTIKISMMFEEMRNDPGGLHKALGIRRHSDIGTIKKKLKLGPLSPSFHQTASDKRLFDTITKDVRDYQASKQEMRKSRR